MLEMIRTIALLCQVTGTISNNYSKTIDYDEVNSLQKECHKQLIECINKKKHGTLGGTLQECILESKY